MDIVTKDYPVTDSGVDEKHPNGAFEVVLSAPTLDRDGEIVDSKAFDPLPSHLTFDTDHSMTCDSVVGSGVPFYADDGTLRVKGSYCADERSQMIRQKVADGHIRATSVTMLAAKRERDDKGVPHVVSAELVIGTFTPVPANRESIVLAAKSLGEIVESPQMKTLTALVELLADRVRALEDAKTSDEATAAKAATDAAEAASLAVGTAEARARVNANAVALAFGS